MLGLALLICILVGWLLAFWLPAWLAALIGVCLLIAYFSAPLPFHPRRPPS